MVNYYGVQIWSIGIGDFRIVERNLLVFWCKSFSSYCGDVGWAVYRPCLSGFGQEMAGVYDGVEEG